MTTVSVNFCDAARLARWCAVKDDLYDKLTLEVERADVLTGHLADRLETLSDAIEGRELYALALVADSVRQRLALIIERAKALLDAGGEA